MGIIDAGNDSSNQGVQEKDEKSFYGLNAFNFDVRFPHLASVGTSIVSTIIALLILYGVYRLLRHCWMKREQNKRTKQQRMLMALHNMGGNPQHNMGNNSQHNPLEAALAGAAHLPGTAGVAAGAAGAAAHALQQLHQQVSHYPSAPPAKAGNAYPMIPGFAV